MGSFPRSVQRCFLASLVLSYPPDGTERYNCNYVSLMTCLAPSSSTCLRAPAKCTCQILLHTSDVVKSLCVFLLSLCLSDAVLGRRCCRSPPRSAEVAASAFPPPLGQSGPRELCCFASLPPVLDYYAMHCGKAISLLLFRAEAAPCQPAVCLAALVWLSLCGSFPSHCDLPRFSEVWSWQSRAFIHLVFPFFSPMAC